MLDLGRVPVYVPAHFQAEWLRNEESIMKLGQTLQQTTICTHQLQAVRQVQRWAQQQAQEHLPRAKAASAEFQTGIPFSTPQQLQALSWLDDCTKHATSQLVAELDVDVLRIWKVLLYYKSAFAAVVFNGKDPQLWNQHFGANAFSPRMFHCLDEFKLYFRKLAEWAAATRMENVRLESELQETKQALKEARAHFEKVAVSERAVGLTTSLSPQSTTSQVPAPITPAVPARADIVQPIVQPAQPSAGPPMVQLVMEPEVSVVSEVAVVKEVVGKTVAEAVAGPVVRPLVESEVTPVSGVEVELKGIKPVSDTAVSPMSEVKVEVREVKPASDVGVGHVGRAEVAPIAEPASEAAVQPVKAAAPVSVVDTAAEPEVEQASFVGLYRQWQLRHGSSGPAVPGVGKSPAGFHETTTTLVQETAVQPVHSTLPSCDVEPAELALPAVSAEPMVPAVPAVPAAVASEARPMGDDGSVVGSSSVGCATPQSPAWAISAKRVPDAELSTGPAQQADGNSTTEPQGHPLAPPSHPTCTAVETTGNVQGKSPAADIDPQHAQRADPEHAKHAADTSLPSLEAMQAAKDWALPVLGKIKGSTAGVEDLWLTLQNSPTAEALAVCEASLGKSAHVSGFVRELLVRVSEDKPDGTMGAMDAADPTSPKLSKSKKRKLRKKAARATPPSYPSPEAMEAAKGWAVPVIQRIRGSNEGVEALWGSLQSTPVTEVMTVVKDRLGKSALVSNFLNRLMRLGQCWAIDSQPRKYVAMLRGCCRSISGGEDGSPATALVSVEDKLSNTEKRKLRRWTKEQCDQPNSIA